MSQSSVARWNAIPMNRQGEQEFTLKRKRQEDEMNTGDDDDDVSLASRSPSPVDESMDVDPENHISKYDEFVRRPEREVITVETKIKSTNRGFALLAKMGWTEGQPLGMSPDGRVDPVPFEIKQDSTGLGKTSQDVRMVEETVSQRRELDSERQTKESEEQRKAREDAVARKVAVQDEISTTLRAFHCELCDKQFKNVAQYDEHTNSYAHHHKARFRDMQANARLKPQDEIDKRKEKERKREERELRKIAAASGIRMPKIISQAAASPAAVVADASSSVNVDNSSVPKKGGWMSVAAPPESSSSTGPKRSGWATVGSAPPPPPTLPPPPPESSASSGPMRESSSFVPAPPSAPPSSHTPSFRTGGWTSLDTSTATAQPVGSSSAIPQTHSSHPPPPPPPQSTGGWTSIPATAAVPPSHPPAPSAPTSSFPPAPTAPAEPKLSGWQKFQAKNTKRK